MSDARMDAFLRFSVETTAFDVVTLRGTGNANSFLATAVEVVGAELMDDLFAAYDSVTDTDEAARERRLRQMVFGDERLGPVARNLIKLWFLGTWYQLPAAWRDRYGARPKDVTFTVSPNAYTQALLWPAVGANPAGANPPGYGSWAAPPTIPPF